METSSLFLDFFCETYISIVKGFNIRKLKKSQKQGISILVLKGLHVTAQGAPIFFYPYLVSNGILFVVHKVKMYSVDPMFVER